VRSGGFGAENSNCGAGGRIGGWLGRDGVAAAPLAGANAGGGGKNGGTSGAAGFAGAKPRGGVGAGADPTLSTKRFPQS
jgi:hypothetical protein